MLKNTIVAACSLIWGTFGFAGTMGPICQPGNTTVPCITKQWDLGIQALYFKPTYDAQSSYIVTTANTFEAINNPWDWGYRLEGSYHFNTGNDVNLDWTSFNQAVYLSQLNINNTNRFDRVNLVFGQHVDFSQSYTARFYGGLQYASIRNYQLQNNFALDSSIVNQQRNTEFTGVGPVIGVDLAYSIGSSGLHITANSSTSILRGISQTIVSNALPSNLVISNSNAHATAMAPSFEEKFGLNYQIQLSKGLLTLDGGYQTLNYFNTFTRLPTTGVISGNFGLFGPYFGMRWLEHV